MNTTVTNYYRSNDVQRQDALDVLKQYSNVIKWREDGQDSLLDIGCGSGDVMMDLIMPVMPKNFGKMVGVDIAEDMVKHARLLYQKSNVTFEKCNIAGDVKALQADHPEGFDHITSFYCLHWEHNQKMAIKNIYDLLNQEGDCLLVFLGKHPVYDVYTKLSQNNKWKPFMNNVNRFISPYHSKERPDEDFKSLLSATGFSNYDVKLVEKTYIYRGLNTLKRNVLAINPFLGNMTDKERDEFFEDYIQTLVQMKIAHIHDDESDYRFVTTYKLIIAYAMK